MATATPATLPPIDIDETGIAHWNALAAGYDAVEATVRDLERCVAAYNDGTYDGVAPSFEYVGRLCEYSEGIGGMAEQLTTEAARLRELTSMVCEMRSEGTG